MSNEPNISKKLTSEEIIARLAVITREARNEAKVEGVEHDWARSAIKEHDTFIEGKTNCFPIPTEIMKQRFPQFYNEVILAGMQQANDYRKPLHPDEPPPPEPKFITITDEYNAGYRPNENVIKLGLPFLKKHSSDEIITAIAHEWVHADRLQNENSDANNAELNKEPSLDGVVDIKYRINEIDADRAGNSLSHIAVFLKDLTVYGEWYALKEADEKHPNFRTLIKALVKKTLGDDIYGINGQWKEGKDGHLEFVPNTLENSIVSVKQSESADVLDKYKNNLVAIDGRVVANGEQLNTEIEKQAEQLMKRLDSLVASDGQLTKLEATRFQKSVEVQSEQFKKDKKHQPEYLTQQSTPFLISSQSPSANR